MSDQGNPSHPIARLFLQNRHLLVLFLLIAIVGGISAFQGLPRLEDPIITNRNPLIVTLYPGASASRVESLVTEKIEIELKEIPEIKTVDSTSRAGVSVVAIELADHINRKTNQQVFSKIRDRLSDAEVQFPEGVLPPQFDDMRNAVAYTLIVGLRAEQSEAGPLTMLSRLGEELADQLRSVGGTELVRVHGESDLEIAVTVDKARMTARGLTLPEVAAALRSADAKVPSGFLRGASSSIAIETSGELDTLGRIREVPIATSADGGQVIRLADVATIERAYRDPPFEIAVTEGGRSVLVAARVQPEMRVDLWAEQARGVVNEFETAIGGGIAVETLFDQGEYTSARLQQLTENLLLGALVVLAVVVLTMGWRSSLIVGLALPITAALTLFVIALSGGKLHQMSIFGMIIALGLLIDNAIVMTDEVRKNRRMGLSPLDAYSRALHHLFLPLLSSTVTTMLAFMPILLLPGPAGDFVSSISSSVIVALGASFLVATTVIGAVASLFSPSSNPGSGERKSRAFSWLREGIQLPRFTAAMKSLILNCVKRPALGIGISLVIPLVGFGLASTLGSQFFPRTDRNMFEVEVWLPTEASIDETQRLVGEIEDAIRERDEVTRVSWLVGGSFPTVYYNLIMNQDNSPHYAHGIVTATDFEAVSAMIGPLQAEIDERFPEAQVMVTRFAQGPPADADVEFRISGPGIETLQSLGEQARRILAEHPGILHTQVTMPRGEPKIWLETDEKAARFAGLSLTEIAGQLQGALEGATGGTLVEAFDEMPVRVRYGSEQRNQIDDLKQLNLRPVDGSGEENRWVPVSALGEFEITPELGGITRRDGIRTNKVLGFARPDALAIDIATEVQAALEAEGFTVPPGYRFTVGGESENQAEAVGNLMLYLPVIIVLTVALLVLSFRNARIALILLLAAPLSVGYGLLATWAMQFPLSFNTIIGSMGLMGLAFNSSIVVIAAIRANDLAKEGHPRAIADAVLGSGRHLVSTTLTTMGSFLPLLIFIGGQFWPPLAIVLAGGVGGSTLLAVLFTPSLYRMMLCRDAKKVERESENEVKNSVGIDPLPA